MAIYNSPINLLCFVIVLNLGSEFALCMCVIWCGINMTCHVSLLCMYIGGVVTMLDIPRREIEHLMSFKHHWRKKGMT